jgi:hypothetical protein
VGQISDIDKLRFYREEVKHEFGLLAMRSNILVTCQSFLVVPFAILNTVANFRAAIVSVYLVAALGIFVALILVAPIRASHRTIEKWLLKQRDLFKAVKEISALALDRDTINGIDMDISRDRDHSKSLLFSKYAPWVFLIFWILAVAWTTIRVNIGL